MYKPCFVLYLFVLVAVASCYDENSVYGERLVSSSFRNVQVDTSTVWITSVLIDSLETSGKGIALTGEYVHPLWGKMLSSTFIPYERPSYSADADETVILDSLVLLLSPNGYFVGDTTMELTVGIHLLTEKISLNDNGYLYNKSSVTYDEEPLATYTFSPKPRNPDFLEIRLSDALGHLLLTKFHTNDQAVSSDRFEDYFKGIALIPEGESNQVLLAFSVADTAAAISLRYHITDELENSRELLFKAKNETQFNHIIHDRTGTLMENYPSRQVEISSGALGNRGVLMCGIGWYTRLEFPYLNNLREQGEYITIEQARLKIYPEPGSYSSYNTLPDSVYLYIADENNVITDAVKDYLGEEVQVGTLIRDDTFDENTYYYFDVTDFMQQESGASGKYKHNLQLVYNAADYTGTLKNLTIGDQQGRTPIILQLTYTIYESY
ncbi:MAG: DUF4270 domain-containing protein [Tannerellaceae bacterium]|jgi:hypothetical protein|nr:DUF4270 domain-containing protein [Tannerellaceae bacterium]